MKIIADENMPNAKALFSHIGQVELVNGRNLTPDKVMDADILLVRSVTKVTRELLEGSSVKFVGSATIGVDHIDINYLNEKNITFTSAPGCNAEAVADYVFSALGNLYFTRNINWLSKKIGIIGYGNVGKTVYQRFSRLNCDLCVYDPYKQGVEAADDVSFVSLDEILSCDVICLHAPLTDTGEHPTKAMIGSIELNQLRPGAAIISAGRGGVVDEVALVERHKQLNGDLYLALDVWANEPSINQDLVAVADIATPHIAGYSKQGREKGSWMVYLELCKYLNIPPQVNKTDAISAGVISSIQINSMVSVEEELARSCHSIYDCIRDDARLRCEYRKSDDESVFDWLRKYYIERDELNTCFINGNNLNTKLLASMGFSVSKK